MLLFDISFNAFLNRLCIVHNQNKCSLRGKLAASNGIPAADDPLRGVSILVYPHAYIAAAAAYENEIIIVEKRHSNICMSHLLLPY